MSAWISSKLKVAETLLQQIDQQAAESLRKNEKSRYDDTNFDTPPKTTTMPPLKDQLKKKAPQINDSLGKLHIDPHIRSSNGGINKEFGTSRDIDSKSRLTDSDWTQLLSAPNNTTRKQGDSGSGSGSTLLSLRSKRNQKSQNSVLKSLGKSNIVSERKVNSGVDGTSSDVEHSRFSELRNDGEHSERGESIGKEENVTIVQDRNQGKEEINGGSDAVVDGKQDFLIVQSNIDGVNNDRTRLGSDGGRVEEANEGQKSSVMKRGSLSVSDEEESDSDTDSDSDSTSDSENEREREENKRRREQILAEKAAAKAIEAIKQRENLVARLEGEKQSLEKMLEERANQQAQEASELQMTMMETMEAVDVEKQKHNTTRMEALARLAKLETANADLARSLANAQWKLEEEANRVAELRHQIALKERNHEELKRKISSTHQTGNNAVASKGVEFEREILEAEYAFVSDKVGRLQEKAKALEESIEATLKEIKNPTEVEVELKRRLGLLTDHLIQKQLQVEALSSEKSMLLFRIEAVSRMLNENKSMLNITDLPSTSLSRDDLESGIWEQLPNTKLRPMFEERLRSGQKHFGSLVRQLDSIFSAGAVFLRRNSTARIWAFIYLLCLHLWVLYILRSHSPVPEEATFGAVVSLENLNNTGGVQLSAA